MLGGRGEKRMTPDNSSSCDTSLSCVSIFFLKAEKVSDYHPGMGRHICMHIHTHARVHTHTHKLWNLRSSNTDTYQPFSAWTLTQNDKGGSPKVTCSHHHGIMPLESHQLLQVFLFGELRSRAYECRKLPLSSPE